ncbi:hypothetical protein EB796_022013 [Bugula neritina]|uniref:Uncharacterized protein n=1 Tax=Bugula neritina TaxID=10212 RepID=A0A7J7J0E9_BUGNE|nr:hypothetical protein EB796_022013 [Bugula neritina]
MNAIKAEGESIHTLDHKPSKTNKSIKPYLHTTDKEANIPAKSNCGNCGNSHPPRKCPAYDKQCSNCKKFNHFRAVCRSRRTGRINAVAEHIAFDESSDSESLMYIQVVKKGKRLTANIDTESRNKRLRLSTKYLVLILCSDSTYNCYNPTRLYVWPPYHQSIVTMLLY